MSNKVTDIDTTHDKFKNDDTSKSSKLFSFEDFKFLSFYIGMSGIGIYHRFIENAHTVDFIISEKGDWTLFILNTLGVFVRTNCWYLGIFGIILTLFKRNLIKFHTYYTTFSYIVFATILISYCIR